MTAIRPSSDPASAFDRGVGIGDPVAQVSVVGSYTCVVATTPVPSQPPKR